MIDFSDFGWLAVLIFWVIFRFAAKALSSRSKSSTSAPDKASAEPQVLQDAALANSKSVLRDIDARPINPK